MLDPLSHEEHRLTQVHKSVGDKCRQMFTLLEEHMAPRQAMADLEHRVVSMLEHRLLTEAVAPMRHVADRLSEVWACGLRVEG